MNTNAPAVLWTLQNKMNQFKFISCCWRGIFTAYFIKLELIVTYFKIIWEWKKLMHLLLCIDVFSRIQWTKVLSYQTKRITLQLQSKPTLTVSHRMNPLARDSKKKKNCRNHRRCIPINSYKLSIKLNRLINFFTDWLQLYKNVEFLFWKISLFQQCGQSISLQANFRWTECFLDANSCRSTTI